MKLRLAFLLSVLVLIPASATAAPRPQSLLEKAQKALRQVMAPRGQRAVGEEATVAAVREANAADDPDENPVVRKARTDRHARLEAQAEVQAKWIKSVVKLDEQQAAKLETVIVAVIKTSQDQWKKKPNRGWQNGDRDFIPFEFSVIARELNKSISAGIRNELTAEQRSRLTAATDERDKQLTTKLGGMAMLQLDRELFLSPTHREPVEKVLKQLFADKVYTGLFAFYNNSWPYQRATFPASKQLEQIIGKLRAKRLQRLTSADQNQDRYVMIRSTDGDASEQFKTAKEAQPARLAEAMAIRIAWLAEKEDLSEKQKRRLEIAAKGATSRVIDKWVETSEKQVQSMQERFAGQNVSWGLSLPTVTSVESHPLWCKHRDRAIGIETPARQSTTKKSALSAFISNLTPKRPEPKAAPAASKSEREKYHDGLLADYVIAVLDQELWLNVRQRNQLREIIQPRLATFDDYWNYGSGQYAELQILAGVLHQTDTAKVEAALNKEQVGAWTALKEMLPVQQNNYIKLSYRYGDIQFPLAKRRGRR